MIKIQFDLVDVDIEELKDSLSVLFDGKPYDLNGGDTLDLSIPEGYTKKQVTDLITQHKSEHPTRLASLGINPMTFSNVDVSFLDLFAELNTLFNDADCSLKESNGVISLNLPNGYTEQQVIGVINNHKAKVQERELNKKTVEIQSTVQNMIDSKCYEVLECKDIDRALGYKTSKVVEWATKAQAIEDWRDSVWMYCYHELDKVNAGTRTMPTVDEFLLELPAFILPA